ncbi:unnamed protein product [Plutella xylostella]|uniref:(diamondback moth) hypothetical protein n=1 Tax=Plutella xylostella TaxID=51655 RepID=A0A8S4DYT9_PLUXY|nr:unnamed protein product [Plutella xylostella]
MIREMLSLITWISDVAGNIIRVLMCYDERDRKSGYLLRKFKNSHGWQKLWVVYAVFSLYFYKSWQDDAPLASLPLLGYTVGAPSEKDGVHKEFVFKLQYKNHVYFFRADTAYTYAMWTEALQTAMVHSQSKV